MVATKKAKVKPSKISVEAVARINKNLGYVDGQELSNEEVISLGVNFLYYASEYVLCSIAMSPSRMREIIRQHLLKEKESV